MNEMGAKAMEELHAYHDGELRGLARWRFERRLRREPELRQQLDRLAGLGNLVRASETEAAGPELAEGAMEVYAHLGEYDQALGLLEILLSVPSHTSVPLIRVDPLWDPVREDPRFVRLVEEYGDN